MVIRQAIEDDIFSCYTIEFTCFEPSEAATKEKIQQRQSVYPEGFIVAEKASEVIGFINSGATNKPDLADEAFKGLIGHDPSGQHMVIFSIAVHPAHQGQGISTHLMTAFCDRARAMSKQSILLLCKEHLITYYTKFGFEEIGPSVSTHGGFQWHEMRLIL